MKPSHLFLVLFGFQVLALAIGQSDFTDKEKAALAKFRPLVEKVLVQDYQKLDTYLMRWLRDSSLNINDAVAALTEAQQWRKDNKIDTILQEKVLEFSDPPESIEGFDNEGRPVIIWSAKKLDVRKLVVGGEVDKFLRYTIFAVEKVMLKARESLNGTDRDSQIISILDIEGYNLKQHGCIQCLGVYVDWTRHISKYYPGSLKYDIWINVPRIAMPVLELIKPIRTPLYQKAHKVFGTEKKEWSTFLLSIIPKEQLGFQYGGTRKN